MMWWWFPAIVTVWAWWRVLRAPPEGHGYSMENALGVLLSAVEAGFITLVVWLLYFVARVACGC